MNENGTKDTVSPDELAKLTELALEFQKGYKALGYYPPGHPSLDQAIRSSFRTIEEISKDLKNITISVNKKGFFIGNQQIGKGISPLSAFAGEFYVRGVRKIFFMEDLKLSDIDSFLRIIHMSPRQLSESGGVESLLSSKGVRSIWLNEVSYDKLIGRELSYEGDTDKINLSGEPAPPIGGKEKGPPPKPSGKTSHSPPPGQLPGTQMEAGATLTAHGESGLFINSSNEGMKKLFSILSPGLEQRTGDNASDKEKKESAAATIENLLRELKGPIEDKRYIEIVSCLTTLALEQAKKGKFEQPLKILKILSIDIDRSRGISMERQRADIDGIRQITTPVVFSHLIKGLFENTMEKAATAILLKVGEAAIAPLLDALTETDNISHRRKLARVIEKFGAGATRQVVERLSDPRWFVVRNMLSILGEIGTENEINQVDIAFDNKYMRVKKEAVKTMSKIGGREAVRILIRRFQASDKELQRLIIFSLGLIDEPVAIPFLLKILNTKPLFQTGPDLRKEAISALGVLRQDAAVPALEEVLNSDGIILKERPELRIAAAEALASIHSDRAMEALKRGAATGNDGVRQACERLTSRKP